MKQFFYIWIAWACFLAAIVTIAGEISRYIIGNYVAIRAIYICVSSSWFLAIWWHIINKKEKKQ